MRFGLAMLPAESAAAVTDKKPKRQMGEKANAAAANGDDVESNVPKKRDRFAAIEQSMPFDGLWVRAPT